MAYGLPADGEANWGQKVNASIEAVKTTADAAASGLTGKLDASQKGAASGIAPLDSGSRVPDANLPERLSESSLSASIDARVPQASTTAQGKVELATTAEVATGTDTDRAVTPASAGALFVQNLNVVADDTTDNAATIQAALTAISALGGGEVRLPKGSIRAGTRLDIPANVTLRGAQNGGTRLRATAGLATPLVRLRGLTDVALEDMSVEHNGTGSNVGVIVELPNNTDVAVRHRIQRVRITGTTNNALRVVNPVTDIRVTENVIDACAQGISFQPQLGSSSAGIKIHGNVVRGLTGTSPGCLGIQLYGASGGTLFSEVEITGNTVADGHADTIPIEVGRCARVVIANNIVKGTMTRGISTGNNTDIVIANNSISDQTTYAIEFGANVRGAVVGNIARNCHRFLDDTMGGSSDFVAVGNTIIGTGLSAPSSNMFHFKLTGSSSNVVIANNLARSMDYIQGFARIGGGTNIVIRDNLTISDTANSPITHYVLAGTDISLRGNVCKISRATVAGDENQRVVSVIMGSTTGLVAEGNEVIFTGSVAATTAVVGIGTNYSDASTVARSVVRRNRVYGANIGIFWNTTSADSIVEDNDTRTCTTDITLGAAVVRRRTRVETEGTAAPTSGTWVAGDRCWNTAPSAGGAPGWVCVTGGTPGTWKAMANLAA